MYSSIVKQGQAFAMFCHRGRLRRWAAGVLVLWFFGVVSGVAHACLAQDANGMATAHADVAAATDAGHDIAHSKAFPVQHSHHDQPGGANCQDFCDKSAISIPPLKSALDLAQADALLPPVAAILYPVAAYEPVQWWLPRRDGGLGPPITITLLRLAL